MGRPPARGSPAPPGSRPWSTSSACRDRRASATACRRSASRPSWRSLAHRPFVLGHAGEGALEALFHLQRSRGRARRGRRAPAPAPVGRGGLGALRRQHALDFALDFGEQVAEQLVRGQPLRVGIDLGLALARRPRAARDTARELPKVLLGERLDQRLVGFEVPEVLAHDLRQESDRSRSALRARKAAQHLRGARQLGVDDDELRGAIRDCGHRGFTARDDFDLPAVRPEAVAHAFSVSAFRFNDEDQRHRNSLKRRCGSSNTLTPASQSARRCDPLIPEGFSVG